MKAAFALFAVFILLMIARKARYMTGGMVSPSRVHLRPAMPRGKHARDLKNVSRELGSRGFALLGTYHVKPMQGVTVTAFSHTAHQLCAICTTHPLTGSHLDMVIMSEAGRSLTVTTAPVGGQLDQREGHEKLFDRHMTVDRMIEVALEKRPPGPWLDWNAPDFVTRFEDAYADEMEWRMRRGGVTHEEVRRTAEAMGGKYSERDVLEATRRLQRQYASSRRSMR